MTKERELQQKGKTNKDEDSKNIDSKRQTEGESTDSGEFPVKEKREKKVESKATSSTKSGEKATKSPPYDSKDPVFTGNESNPGNNLLKKSEKEREIPDLEESWRHRASSTATDPQSFYTFNSHQDERRVNGISVVSSFRSKCRCLYCCCFSCSCLAIQNQEDRKKKTKDSESDLICDTDSLPSLEEIRSWGESFDKLMGSSKGRKLFREFLKCEYSEENILFWLACEDLKQETKSQLVEEKARLIYEDYISILSPKEVSLDARVREVVNQNMTVPTPHTFDEAQLQIYTLMHRDSYPRFVNSPLYKKLAQLNNNPPNRKERSGSSNPSSPMFSGSRKQSLVS